MSRSAKIAVEIIAGVVVAALLLVAGFFFGMSPDFGGKLQNLLPSGCSSSSAAPSDAALQQEILQQLETHYYKAIDPQALSVKAIDGMIGGLEDPYTVYMDPQEYADFMRTTSGSYSGVGMTVELIDGLVTIVSTFKGSPAQVAGILPGDIITKVDGTSVAGLELQTVVSRIIGPKDTTVALEVYRPPTATTTTTEGATTTTTLGPSSLTTTTTIPTADNSNLPAGGTTTQYSLTRKTIAIPVTEMKTLDATGKKVAYISFLSFSDGSAKALRAEVQTAVATDQDAAIILDLRGNGGGLLTEAVAVASIFVPSGRIVSDKGLNSPEQVYNATGNAYGQIPVYVLTDEYTASASEIVSGALQDYGRATVVGGTTFGKGLVQTLTPLSNGGALKLTTAVYLTPKGRDINQKGIVPDVVAPDDPATPDVDETVQKTLSLISAAK